MARFKARSFLLAILLAFVVAMTGFGTAFADTTDPYLAAYDDFGSERPWETYVVGNGVSSVEFLISPTATDFDGPPLILQQ